MKKKALIEIKPNIIPIPIKSREQEEKDFWESEEQLLKSIARLYRVSVKDIIRRKVIDEDKKDESRN